MSRIRRRTTSDFIGLDLSKATTRVSEQHAIVASNVRIDSGKVVPRLGRVELAEDQINVHDTLGLAEYTPPDRNPRSIVFIRSDGIYQRKG